MKYCILLSILLSSWLSAAEPTYESLKEHVSAGVFVHAGAEDGSLAIAAAKAGPVLSLVLTDADKVESIRNTVFAAGLAGQVQVQTGSDKLPLLDGIATTVVLGDARVSRAEAERALGARGVLIEPGKPVWTKPVPKEYDDWGQYFYNGAATDVSQDTAVKPVTGLQWTAGTRAMPEFLSAQSKMGLRIAGGILLHVKPDSLIARDARNGVPMWRRDDITVDKTEGFGFLADAALNKIWLLPAPTTGRKPAAPRYMQVLELSSGKTLYELDQGLDLGLAKGRKINRGDFSPADAVQARLDQGKLLVVSLKEMVMLDAVSGKRLWHKVTPQGSSYWTPVLSGGTVYVVRGARVQSSSYTHWPMGTVSNVLAFDAASGEEKWNFTWPKDVREIAGFNMTYYQGELAIAGALTIKPSDEGVNPDRARLLVLNAATGLQKHFVDLEDHDGLLRGHSHIRVMGIGDRWWFNGIYAGKSVSIANPGDKSQWQESFGGVRPVECTVWRATTNYLLGAGSLGDFSDQTFSLNTAAKSACDIGSFPADGLLFMTETGCWCRPYLPGLVAMNSHTWPSPDEDNRLLVGNAKPAPAPAANPDAWPQYLQSSWRGAWNPAALQGNSLQPRWNIKALSSSAADSSIQKEWNDLLQCQSPLITGVSVAEGVAVYALTPQGVVIAVAPDSGKELWRVVLDGRIDSQPTIHQGLVFVGTHSGWVHALNRDNGQTVWSYRAAPHDALQVANGLLASVWPVNGAVTIIPSGLFVSAGRHSEMDGGIYWSILDPTTGKVKKSGVWRAQISGDRRGKSTITGETMNMPPVTDGEHFLLAHWQTTLAGGTMESYTPPVPDSAKKAPRWKQEWYIPLMRPGLGTLTARNPENGYNQEQYAGTLSRQFAYQPDHNTYFAMGGKAGGYFWGRGGDPTGLVLGQEKMGKPAEGRRAGGSTELWQVDFGRSLAENYGLRSMAVSSDRVLVGLTYEGLRHSWKRGKNNLPMHCLAMIDAKTGNTLQKDIELPAPPITGGISIAQGRVFVVCEDGSIHCFGAK